VKQVRFRNSGMEVQTDGGDWVPARIVPADQPERVESAGMADYPRETVFPSEDSGVTRDSDDMTRLHRLLDAAGIDPTGTVVDRVTKLAKSRHELAETMDNYFSEKGNPVEPEARVPEDIWTREQEIQRRVEEISGWWQEHAAAVIDRTAPKAAEYGAADLDLMGVAMQQLFQDKIAGMTQDEKDQFGRYAACAFYLNGKIARIFGALERGVLPNPDSEFDTEVYAVMLTRIREFGRWV
jgi:hypothetical protein